MFYAEMSTGLSPAGENAKTAATELFVSPARTLMATI